MFFWCDVSLPLDVHDFCRLSEKVGLPMQIPQENSPFFLLQNHTIPFPSNLNTHRTSKKDSFPKGNPPPLSESGASKFFGAGLACSVRCCFQPNQPTNQPTNQPRKSGSQTGEALRNASVAGQVDIVKSLLLVKPKDDCGGCRGIRSWCEKGLERSLISGVIWGPL